MPPLQLPGRKRCIWKSGLGKTRRRTWSEYTERTARSGAAVSAERPKSTDPAVSENSTDLPSARNADSGQFLRRRSSWLIPFLPFLLLPGSSESPSSSSRPIVKTRRSARSALPASVRMILDEISGSPMHSAVIAREYGFDSWARFKQYLNASPPDKVIFDAVAGDDANAVESLLEDDPTLIDARGGWQLFRPLFFAMQRGPNATIEVLRRHGATRDIFEASALGNVAELRNLLSESPELANARREHCDGTPLHAARERRSSPIAH